MQFATDFLIIGSGIAGLSYALEVAKHGSVIIITKKDRAESNTNYAQGGIAAVMDGEDSWQSHIQDTLEAGAGLCHLDTVKQVVREGPEQIERLIRWGVEFSKQEAGHFDLGREGGHSARRILHARDATGRHIESALLHTLSQLPHVQLLENHFAIDLITNHKLGRNAEPLTCLGAYVLETATGAVHTISAKTTLLATGGAGKVYLYTSNPDIATGDGMAMAYRAGAQLANLEFVQFHPTCLYHPEAKSFLISEALRGEGALLRLPNGQRFMQNYHTLAELAPRDVVARAIDHEMKKGGFDYVLLDISMKPAEWIRERFPMIAQQCLRFGLDITSQPIPVVPAAHYFCGGVVTNQHAESNIARLYAAGETACTGLHGANRLASNSLLEALVFAQHGAQASIALQKESINEILPAWDETQVSNSDEQVVITQNWDEIRRFMWNYVGIVRSVKRLERAQHRIKLLQEEIQDYYWNFKVTADLLELRNIALIAELIIRCAQSRHESRGLHTMLDFPETKSDLNRDTFVQRV